MKSDIRYRVVKNTLAKFAAEKAGKNELAPLFEGPVAIAFGYGDVVEPAKALVEHVRAAKISLRITGGFFGDTVLTPAEVETLAKLPSREILLAQVLGGIQSPIVMLLSCLASPMRGLMGVLQARINQLEGE
jgi:large subunit ribosomal protein L10